MKKNVKILLLILLVILIVIILLFVKNNTNLFSNEGKEEKISEEAKHIIENGWMKSKIEYYVDGKLDYTLDKLENMYIDFKEDKIEFCNKDEKSAIVCNSYDYKFGDNNLTVYKLDDDEDVLYSYEIVENDLLILTFESKKFVTKNYYDRVLH